MSYEREGFDPTDIESTEHQGAQIEHLMLQKLGVHIVDAAKIIKKAGSEPVQLVDAELGEGSYSDSIRLLAEVGPRQDQTQPPAHLYNGAVLLGHSASRPWVHFEEHLKYDDFGDVTIRPFGDKRGWRLIGDATGTFETALRYKPTGDRVRITNEYVPKDPQRHPERVLRAPAAEGVDDKRAQLVHYLNSLVMGAHVANSLAIPRGILSVQDLIVTPDGPLYRHPVSGTYVHNLKRDVVVLNPNENSSQPPFLSPPRGRRRGRPSPEAMESPLDGLKVPTESLDDLYGIDEIKAALQPIVAYYRHPAVMRQWNIDRPAAGVLLKGPAGTGKTTIVKALAHEIGAKLKVVSPSDVSRPYIGESEVATQAIFDDVRDATEPVIVFFDELEASISSNNTGSDSGAYVQNAVAAIFKKETAAIADSNPNVLFAAATNFADRIDEGLIRAGRFDIKLTVGLPDETARMEMLRSMIIQEAAGKLMVDVDPNADDAKKEEAEESDPIEGRSAEGETALLESTLSPMFDQDILDETKLCELARITDGYTGADLRNMLRQTKLRKALSQIATGSATPISVLDLRTFVTTQQRS